MPFPLSSLDNIMHLSLPEISFVGYLLDIAHNLCQKLDTKSTQSVIAITSFTGSKRLIYSSSSIPDPVAKT